MDYYPTPPDVTQALIDFLWLPESFVIWEPACGDGAMSRVLAQHHDAVISTDIRQTGFGEGGIDFLQTRKEVDAIITNPPFAQSGEFILHALSQTGTVAMLLKSQYWHAMKRAALFAKHPPAWMLALTWRPDFMFGQRGGAPTMECLWSVWLPGETDTRYRLLTRPGR